MRRDIFLVFLVLTLVLTLPFERTVYACQVVFVLNAVLRAALGLVQPQLRKLFAIDRLGLEGRFDQFDVVFDGFAFL